MFIRFLWDSFSLSQGFFKIFNHKALHQREALMTDFGIEPTLTHDSFLLQNSEDSNLFQLYPCTSAYSTSPLRNLPKQICYMYYNILIIICQVVFTRHNNKKHQLLNFFLICCLCLYIILANLPMLQGLFLYFTHCRNPFVGFNCTCYW